MGIPTLSANWWRAFSSSFSRFIPFRYFKHSLQIIRGKYEDPEQPGDITHFQALVSSLAATIGMGNISGVAIAITVGGPGAVFWMWISALVGIATKFFTCSLAIMYRAKDSVGKTQGGPMYVVQEGLGPKWNVLVKQQILNLLPEVYIAFPPFYVHLPYMD